MAAEGKREGARAMKLQKVKKLISGEFVELYAEHEGLWVCVWRIEEEGILVAEWGTNGLSAADWLLIDIEDAETVERVVRDICPDFRRVRGFCF